jgi:hypothetical protein
MAGWMHATRGQWCVRQWHRRGRGVSGVTNGGADLGCPRETVTGHGYDGVERCSREQPARIASVMAVAMASRAQRRRQWWWRWRAQRPRVWGRLGHGRRKTVLPLFLNLVGRRIVRPFENNTSRTSIQPLVKKLKIKIWPVWGSNLGLRVQRVGLTAAVG